MSEVASQCRHAVVVDGAVKRCGREEGHAGREHSCGELRWDDGLVVDNLPEVLLHRTPRGMTKEVRELQDLLLFGSDVRPEED